MADTRKYEPTTGDPIGDAVRAALGETVRPTTPGSKPAASTPAAAAKPTIATLGAYTFQAVPKPPTTTDADPDA